MISNSAHVSDFCSDFVGDSVPRFHLTNSKYPDTMSCVLKPLENKAHSMLYDQIIK
jgi:hypothetical protein